MGYHSRGFDEITLDPPLPWRAFKGSKWRQSSGEDTCLVIVEDVTERETDHGTLSIHAGVAIAWRSEDETRAYTIDAEIRELASLLTEHGVGASGYLTRVGEAQGDVERYRINRSLGAVSEKAELRWPDGSKCDEYY